MMKSDIEQGLHHTLPSRHISLSFDPHIFEIGEDHPIDNTSYDGETSFFVRTLDRMVALYKPKILQCLRTMAHKYQIQTTVHQGKTHQYP